MNGPQRWIKKGLLFAPEQNYDWLQSHAALPVIDRSRNGERVYFSGRDKRGRAQVGFFEIGPKFEQVTRVSERPVIDLGPLGSFDDSGVTTSWIVNHNDKKYLYYSGWSLGVSVPFYFFIGLAISEDEGETYQRISPSPILERDRIDPYLTASPCVLVEDGRWRMWYVSGTGWEMKDDRPLHRYHIKYAESHDGIEWQREGLVCIDYQSDDEYAISRPCVIKDGSGYRMWYASRGNSYRIGYAESADGLKWTRKDHESGIDLSVSGWDSEMVAYPFVFEREGDYYMLYNGNDYGKTGIGLAVLDRD
ncbi:MAG TPA: hypothetical protein VGP85_16445 [Pyrinomonadaceae bacterium]|jgi:hypothetical protein|nr:hypothetical protein [Pyrinomonadaceae bacterium]